MRPGGSSVPAYTRTAGAEKDCRAVNEVVRIQNVEVSSGLHLSGSPSPGAIPAVPAAPRPAWARRLARWSAWALLAAAGPVSAEQSVTLAWNPNPEPDITSYIVYYGTSTRSYPYSTNVGKVTTATVRGLRDGSWFMAVTAVNTSGLESDFSSEVTATLAGPGTNPPPATAGPSVTLAWNRNPEPDIVSYLIYYGTASRMYPYSTNVGNVTTATVYGLEAGRLWYFAVTAVNSSGLESDFSSEVTSWVSASTSNQPPVVSSVPGPTILENGVAGPLAFIVGDAETPAASLAVTGSSSNPALVPDAALVFGGSGSNRTVTLRPAANAWGTALVTVRVSDGAAVASTSFTVTVVPVNAAPTLNPIANGTIPEDAGAQTLTLTGISGGDPEPQVLTVTARSGNPALIPNPSVVYTSPNATAVLTFAPQPNASGSAVITVLVGDGGASNNITTRTFNVTVTDVNDAPTLDPIANQTALDLAGPQTVSLTGIGSGAANEAQTLAVTATADNPALVRDLRVTYTSPNATGTLAYTPVPDADGTATVTVQVQDDGGTNATVTRRFTVTVRRSMPTLDPIADQFVAEDTRPFRVPLSGISAGGASNVALTVTATSSNPNLVTAPVTVTYTSPSTTGMVTLLPLVNATGSSTISVRVQAGTNSSATTRVFTLTVTPVNDPPTVAAIGDQATVGTTPCSLPIFIADIDDAPASLTLSGVSSNPLLVPDANLVFSGAGTNRTLTLTPAAGQVGTARITVTVRDGAGATASAGFGLTVQSAGTAPRITTQPQPQTVAVGGQVTLTVAATGSAPLGYRWQLNGEDLPGATGSMLTLTNVQLPDQGLYTVQVTNGFGTAASEPALLQVTGGPEVALMLVPLGATWKYYDRGADLATAWRAPLYDDQAWAAGPAELGYGDGGEATVIGYGPDPAHKYITTYFRRAFVTDEPLVILELRANLIEDDGAVVYLNGVELFRSNMPTGPISATTLALRADALGEHTFLTRWVDPALLTAGTNIVAVEMHQSDPASPDLSFDLELIGYRQALEPPVISAIPNQVTDEDVSTAAIPFVLSGANATTTNLVLHAQSSDLNLVPTANIFFASQGSNWTVRVVPAPNQSGLARITVVVTDLTGLGSASSSFTVTVRPVNDAPTLTPIGNRGIPEDYRHTVSFGVSDADDAIATLAVTGRSSNPLLVPDANLIFAGTESSRTVTIVPATNQSGIVTITLTVRDPAGATASTSFQVNIVAVNDPPAILPIAAQTTTRNVPVEIPISVLDVDHAASVLVLTGSSSNPQLVPSTNLVFSGSSSNRILRVTPAPNQAGTASLTVSVQDPAAGTAFATFVLTVNDPPTLRPPLDTAMDANTSRTVAVSVSDRETPAANLGVSAQSSNPTLLPPTSLLWGGSDTNRTLTLTPAYNQVGSATLTLTVTDALGASGTASFVVTVGPPPVPPVILIAPQSLTVSNGTTAVFSVSAAGSTPLTYQWQFNGADLPGATSRTLIIPSATSTTAGSYRVRVSNPYGTVTSAAASLTVYSGPQTPAIGPVSQVVIPEDTSAEVLFSVADLDTPVVNLVTTATSTNALLVPLGGLVVSGAGATRSLTITPAPNRSGTTVVDLVVSDGARSNRTSFLVTVTPVNDPPTLAAIADRIIQDDQKITFDVLGISSGADDEIQPLSLSVAADNPALFSELSVAYTSPGVKGQVTLRSAKGVSATGVITVTVSDGLSTTSSSFNVFIRATSSAPTITAIANQTINEDSMAGPLAFTVSDDRTALDQLRLTVRSSDPVLIPPANVVIAGTGASRTVTVTPALNLSGKSTITLIVADLNSGAKAEAFDVTVRPINDAPTLAPIDNQSTSPGVSTGVIPFFVDDPDTALSILRVTATSSNLSLVRNEGIALGGSGTERGLVITPVPGATGQTVITLTVSDGSLSASQSFTLTVL